MKFAHPRHSTHKIFSVCFLGFIFSLHLALPVYINSTYFSTFADAKIVGLLYSAASAATLVSVLFFSRIIRFYGNYQAILLFLGIDAVSLGGLILFNDPWWIGLSFVANTAVIALVNLNIDIFLEHDTDNGHTGGIRGLYLTTVNSAWIMSPIIAGYIVTEGGYRSIYLSSLLVVVPIIFLLTHYFRNFKDPEYKPLTIASSAAKVVHEKSLRNIFCANIFLNFFYGWMVIYTPIYLHQYIKLGWDEIGLIFTIMLLPFVIFELPLGRLADSKFGEKEILSLGFLIIAAFTATLSFVTVPSVALWALLLFMTRVGASMVEIMAETYFFKHIREKDSSILGVYRATRPVGYLLAPIFATTALFFVDFRYSFLVLGIVMLFALRYSLTLDDTR